VQLGELSGKHIDSMITLRGRGEESWSWELKALVCAVEHQIREGQRWTQITVLLKFDHGGQTVGIDLPSTFEIEEPVRVPG